MPRPRTAGDCAARSAVVNRSGRSAGSRTLRSAASASVTRSITSTSRRSTTVQPRRRQHRAGSWRRSSSSSVSRTSIANPGWARSSGKLTSSVTRSISAPCLGERRRDSRVPTSSTCRIQRSTAIGWTTRTPYPAPSSAAELGPHPGEPASLDLDQQVAPNEVDDVAADRDLDSIAVLRVPPLHAGMQRLLPQHPDPRRRRRTARSWALRVGGRSALTRATCVAQPGTAAGARVRRP